MKPSEKRPLTKAGRAPELGLNLTIRAASRWLSSAHWSLAWLLSLLPLAIAHAQLPSTTGWYQLPNTQLRTVCPPNGFGGSTYNFHDLCQGVVSSWNSAAMDT